MATLVPENLLSGSVGLALLFGMLCMAGFEVTVIFRDEVRSPEKTIPRAVAGFVTFVGLLFGVSTWVIIQALGPDAVALTASDPTGAFFATVQRFVGTVGVDVVNVLLVTSVFAALLAPHNVMARYIYSLAVDGILPRSLGRAHRKHGSPARSSLATSAVSLIGLLVLILVGADATVLYAQLIGGFGYALILLLLITSVAIIVFLGRTRPAGVGPWRRIGAPTIALAMFGVTLVLATANIDLLITAGPVAVTLLLGAFFGSVVVGAVTAAILRRRKPQVFARIGRQ